MADALALHNAIWAKLSAISGVNAYDGEVPGSPPLDSDGRVHAYAVLYMLGERRFASTLTGSQTSIMGAAQITCVGGDPTRVGWCVDKVIAAVVGPVTVDGKPRLIRLREEQYRTGRDDDMRPPRHWRAPEFILHAP